VWKLPILVAAQQGLGKGVRHCTCLPKPEQDRASRAGGRPGYRWICFLAGSPTLGCLLLGAALTAARYSRDRPFAGGAGVEQRG